MLWGVQVAIRTGFLEEVALFGGRGKALEGVGKEGHLEPQDEEGRITDTHREVRGQGWVLLWV